MGLIMETVTLDLTMEIPMGMEILAQTTAITMEMETSVLTMATTMVAKWVKKILNNYSMTSWNNLEWIENREKETMVITMVLTSIERVVDLCIILKIIYFI